MILNQNDEIRVTLGAATDGIDPYVAYVDLVDAATTASPNRTPTARITTTTVTAILTNTVSATNRRTAVFISLRNVHASTAITVTVEFFNGTTSWQLQKVTLQAGETLVYNRGTWFVYDASGAVKGTTGASASDSAQGIIQLASQADQEAATDLTKAVTPGRQHFHPSACKAWLKAAGAGTSIGASYNITSITDTGAGRLGVNIGTDFSSANYSVTCSVERSVTTLAVTDIKNGAIRNASQLAGSVEIECWDDTANTHVQEDPANYHAQMFGDL